MKNLLILGLLAALLFSVSAALSLWLNQSKQPETSEKEKDKEKAGKPKSGEPKDAEPKAAEKAGPKAEPPPPSRGPERTATAVREREARLERRAAQVEMVVRDLQAQRESTEAALRAVLAELKTASAETTKLEALAEDLRKKKVEFAAGEKKNIDKIAAMYDAMSPESAAPILKQMAEAGRLDMAAKILVQMKERNAARVLEAMGDPTLALQVVEKMRDLRAAGPAPAPVVPAKGP